MRRKIIGCVCLAALILNMIATRNQMPVLGYVTGAVVVVVLVSDFIRERIEKYDDEHPDS